MYLPKTTVSPPRVELGTFLMCATASRTASFAICLWGYLYERRELNSHGWGYHPLGPEPSASAFRHARILLVIPAGLEPALFRVRSSVPYPLGDGTISFEAHLRRESRPADSNSATLSLSVEALFLHPRKIRKRRRSSLNEPRCNVRSLMHHVEHLIQDGQLLAGIHFIPQLREQLAEWL